MSQANFPKKYETVVGTAAKHGGAAVRAINPLAVITEALQFLKTREEEQTKRAHIEAKRDVLVTALESKKEVILAYFGHRFEERRATLEQFYQLLHRSVDAGNSETLQVALSGILGVMQDNPISDFAEFVRNMENPNFSLEL